MGEYGDGYGVHGDEPDYNSGEGDDDWLKQFESKKHPNPFRRMAKALFTTNKGRIALALVTLLGGRLGLSL